MVRLRFKVRVKTKCLPQHPLTLSVERDGKEERVSELRLESGLGLGLVRLDLLRNSTIDISIHLTRKYPEAIDTGTRLGG